jgi:hypothetical protein
MAATVVEWDKILQVVYSSLGAGLGVTIAFSLAVAGATRFVEQSREGAPARAAVYAALALLGLLVVAAAIVLGIVVMTHKS